jgi:hypothetical protein
VRARHTGARDTALRNPTGALGALPSPQPARRSLERELGRSDSERAVDEQTDVGGLAAPRPCSRTEKRWLGEAASQVGERQWVAVVDPSVAALK